MYLSSAQYTHGMRIEIHGRHYLYHDVNISFTIEPLKKEMKLWQCDAATYLTTGLRQLSTFGLLDSPTKTPDDRALKAAAFQRILNAIPRNSYLTWYDFESGINLMEGLFGDTCSDPSIPEKY